MDPNKTGHKTSEFFTLLGMFVSFFGMLFLKNQLHWIVSDAESDIFMLLVGAGVTFMGGQFYIRGKAIGVSQALLLPPEEETKK